jgi:superfamily II DNA helicase RecQ
MVDGCRKLIFAMMVTNSGCRCLSEDSKSLTEQDLRESLLRNWGYEYFRFGQLEACLAILSGRDCFYMASTGSGKSLTFLLPTMALIDQGKRACSLIISPLISLMEDQVRSLRERGIRACMLFKDSSQGEIEDAVAGNFIFVYCTPEKAMVLLNKIVQLREKTHVVCCAIDECHCVSEWGTGFRPAYRNLSQLRVALGKRVPFMVVTASATLNMQKDVISCLELNNPLVLRSSIDRKNLKYTVKESFISDPQDVVYEVAEFWKTLATDFSIRCNFPPTIIYTMTKQSAEDLAEKILQSPHFRGISVEFYHAGLSTEARSKLLEDFLHNKINLVVATTAFGMGKVFVYDNFVAFLQITGTFFYLAGINKPDIRLVIHYGLPMSIEAYFQQTGRGGRDGQVASCILLWSRDNEKQSHTLANSSIAGCEDPIVNVKTYVRDTVGCRRKFLMNYFNEDQDSIQFLEGNCCDLCDRLKRQEDPLQLTLANSNISREVHMLLMTLYVIGTCFSFKGLLSILLGRHDEAAKKVSAYYSSFEFYGCGVMHQESWWRALLRQLIDVDNFVVDHIRTKSGSQKLHYFTYSITTLGEDFLKGELPVIVPQYSEMRHKYKSKICSELLRLEIAKELKRSHQIKRSQSMLDSIQSSATSISSIQQSSKQQKNSIDMQNGNVFVDFTEYQMQKKLEVTMKQIHSKVRDLIKRERLLIAQRGGFNVQSVFSTTDMTNLLDKIITAEFVAGCPYIPTVSELASRITRELDWATWKTEFAAAIATAILNALHPCSTNSSSANHASSENLDVVPQFSSIDKTSVDMDANINLYGPNYREEISSFLVEESLRYQDFQITKTDGHGSTGTTSCVNEEDEVNIVSLYRPNYVGKRSLSLFESHSADLQKIRTQPENAHGTEEEVAVVNEEGEDLQINLTRMASTTSRAASRAHKKRILMAGLPGMNINLVHLLMSDELLNHVIL